MTKPAGMHLSALLAFLVMASARPALPDAAAAKGKVSAANRSLSESKPAPAAKSTKTSKAPIDPKLRFNPPAALKRLVYSARQGFSLRMVSSEEVTAEIVNGAGRTLAHGSYTLEAGDWTLRPRNLAPGLYTVLLRTGPQLRSLRMKIEDSERGEGSPEWVLEKAADSSAVKEPSPAIQGAALIPVD
ncbi:MAG: hypothetical protein ABIW76_18550 [Fibrobacteria bacterium]